MISCWDFVQHEIQRAEQNFANLRKKKSLSKDELKQWVTLVARLDALRTAEIDRLLKSEEPAPRAE
jgi:hypothetical protein